MDNQENQNRTQKTVVYDQLSQEKKKSLSVLSLVLGIISFIFCWTIVTPLITGIIGIITSIICLIQHREGTNMAIAGLVLSLIGLVIAFIILALIIIGIAVS